ncbi:MAG: helix-turn-helix domain-containing protein [Halochromatium sp.]
MFPQRLKAARQRAGLTQTEIAARLGVSKALPGHWEAGRKVPGMAKLEALAELLDVSVSWLTGDKIGDERSTYEPGETPAEILADYMASPGLRDLASNHALVAALDIQPEEWRALRSLQVPEQFTSEGYVAVLMVLRAHMMYVT